MTEAQAKRLAKQIFDNFDKQIYEATLGTIVPSSFIAGLIANEAGKDRSGNIVRSATRFEPHVYRHLLNVRDGKKSSYNRITKKDLAGASDAAIRALSHSYEATQIMGWHVIKNLHCTVADLRNPDKHFFYTVKLLLLNEDGDISTHTEAGYARAMREWNTGREAGETYHANYVANAAMVRKAYKELEKTRTHRTLDDRINVPIEEIEESAMEADGDRQDYNEPDNRESLPQAAEPQPMPTSELLVDVPAASENTNAAAPQAEASTSTDNFKAFIPQIDRARAWIRNAIAGTSLGGVVAVVMGAPVWVQIAIFVLVLTIVIGAIVIFVKHHDKIFAYVTNMNTLRATEGVGNPIVSGDTPK